MDTSEPARWGRSGRLASVEISQWEIECCVPPPEVGDRVAWPLTFHSNEAEPDGFDRPAPSSGWWRVERRADGATFLVDGPLVAYWSEYRCPPPAPGVVEATGTLFASMHEGSGHSGLPPVAAHVRRLWITSQLYARADAVHRSWNPVAGTLELRQVRSSPRWFDSGPLDSERPERFETGLLVELDLARTPDVGSLG